MRRKLIPPTVIALGLASLFTDLSSEMIYPLLPGFLSVTLGAGAWVLGLIEGASESTASLLKLVSGIWTDRSRQRKPLILAGYGISGLARPLIGAAAAWPWVLALRVCDRVGKGLRSSPRDALIADVTPEDRRGAAYGLHRAMDHAGAVSGPLVAAALLAGGLGVRSVFGWAAVPGLVVLAVLIFAVREPPKQHAAAAPESAPRLGSLRELGRDFRRMLAALFVFTLGNSADAFVLLRLEQAGINEWQVALLWSLHHVVKMAATWLGGHLSDAIGRRRPILIGWAYYALVYLAFAALQSPAALTAVFLAYGAYFGFTEPAEKAWVSELVPAQLRGTAFGWYHLVVGVAALPASLVFGLIWRSWSSAAAFGAGAGLAGLGAVMLLRVGGGGGPSKP